LVSAAVELKDVFRVFSTPEGDAAALQGLSVTVREGELVAVLGPSGSGKTTLLRLLAGLDRPSAGTVQAFGRDLARLPSRQLADYRTRTLGYADQHYGLMLASELTAREIVAAPLALRGMDRIERRRRADELLERVALGDRRRARPQELSGGEQQRVAVCAALAHRPRLFLADEPTGELDTENARRLFDLIGELVRAEGTTTVLVSHDPAAAPVADRVVTIRDGRVAAEALRDGAAGGDAIVVGRGGWLRLPEEYLRRAGIAERARARVEGSEIVIASAAASHPVRGASEPPVEPVNKHSASAVAELRGVSKGYGRGDGFRVVLDKLDASFHAGRLCAVTGPSGSGKTTLLHLLAGLDLPDAGDVVVDGEAISALDRAGRARMRARSIAFVGQEPGLTPFLSATENVELGLLLHEAENGGAVTALSAVGLADRAGQRVSRLSTGERGRVALARAVATGVSLLLVDEPTSRLDEANALAVSTLLARIARETGGAVVCATHDPILVEQADDELSLVIS
jgi:ABC-type lipoprotein export system ATPase subunit